MTPNPNQGPTKRPKAASQTAFTAFQKTKQRAGTGLAETLKEQPIASPKTSFSYYFPVYSIDWDKLQEWMVKKFPKARFPEAEFNEDRSMEDDNYVCNTPERLTELDLADIKAKCTVLDGEA